MYLEPIKFYYNSKKVSRKLKKPQYLENGESDQKSVTNKKDAEFNLLSG